MLLAGFWQFVFCSFVFSHVCILEFLYFVLLYFVSFGCILFCLYYGTFAFCHGFIWKCWSNSTYTSYTEYISFLWYRSTSIVKVIPNPNQTSTQTKISKSSMLKFIIFIRVNYLFQRMHFSSWLLAFIIRNLYIFLYDIQGWYKQSYHNSLALVSTALFNLFNEGANLLFVSTPSLMATEDLIASIISGCDNHFFKYLILSEI